VRFHRISFMVVGDGTRNGSAGFSPDRETKNQLYRVLFLLIARVWVANFTGSLFG